MLKIAVFYAITILIFLAAAVTLTNEKTYAQCIPGDICDGPYYDPANYCCPSSNAVCNTMYVWTYDASCGCTIRWNFPEPANHPCNRLKECCDLCNPPGAACWPCDTQWCPDGAPCAAGHSYCVWDASGNYCGSCVEEVNNCASQCAAPTPTPVPVGCNFGNCGVSCAPEQRYVSGNCWSYGWFTGDGCYIDASCSGGPTPTPIPVAGCTDTLVMNATSPIAGSNIRFTYSDSAGGQSSLCTGDTLTGGVGTGVPDGRTCSDFDIEYPMDRTCTTTGAGSFSWTHYWRPDFDCAASKCQKTITYNITAPTPTPTPSSTPTPTPLPIPPTPTITYNTPCTAVPNAGNEITISWASTSPAVTYVDISTLAAAFSTFWNKQVIPAGSLSVTAPAGFDLAPLGGSPLSFTPGDWYYARTWNGFRNSGNVSFQTRGPCASPTPTPTSSPTPLPSPTPTPSPTIGPWIQVSGDVHSNIGINVRGGP